MSDSLFRLTDKILWVEELLERQEEEPGAGGLTEQQQEFNAKVEKFLDDTDAARKEKLNAYAWLIRKTTAEAEAAREIAKEWSEKARIREGRILALKRALEMHMEAVGQRKIETGEWTFSRVKNSQPEIRVDREELPLEAFIAVEPRVDLRWIREQVKSGAEVPGVQVLEHGHHLRIK